MGTSSPWAPCSEYSGLEVASEFGRVSARKSSAQPRSVLLALRTWAKEVKGRNLICFIDQDAAKQALAKAYSPSRPSVDLIRDILEVAGLNVFPRFARLPTASNPTDVASKLEFNVVLETIPMARLREAVTVRSGY